MEQQLVLLWQNAIILRCFQYKYNKERGISGEISFKQRSYDR